MEKVTLLIDVSLFAKYNKKMSKAKRIIHNLVKDYLILHITRKTIDKEMFDALSTLYQSESINQNTLLRNKLRAT